MKLPAAAYSVRRGGRRRPEAAGHSLAGFGAYGTANIPEIDLTVPEAGVRIWIERNTNSVTYRSETVSGSSNRRPKSYTWVDEMQNIIPACQKWCRAIIKKQTFGIEQSPAHNPSNDAGKLIHSNSLTENPNQMAIEKDK